VVHQCHPGERAHTQGEIVAIGEAFVEAKHALFSVKPLLSRSTN
jgi:hypothetical protein